MLILGTIFRDAESYLPQFFHQAQALNKHLEATTGEELSVIAVEGDSRDDTWDQLVAHQQGADYPMIVLKCEHGGAYFPSVVNRMRWRQLSVAGNVVLAAADRHLSDGQSAPPTGITDAFIYIESDLVADAPTLASLRLDLWEHSAVVPLSLHDAHQEHPAFYDTWGHVGKDFHPFSPTFPYHPSIDWETRAMVPVKSAGSCFALQPWLVPQVAFSHIDCIRGIGRTLGDMGQTLWLDPKLAVYHPQR